MRTTSKRSIELYKSLGLKERAALSLSLKAGRDTVELERLQSTVEWRDYRCMHAEYLGWRDAFTGMAMAWGLMYWQERCQMQALAFAVTGQDAGNVQAFDEADAKATGSLARLMALVGALREVCDQHGLAVADVMRLAGVNSFPSDAEPDADYQAEVTADLLACMPDR